MNNALPTPPKPGLKLLNAGFSLNEQALLYPAGDRARPSSTSATSSFIYSRRLLPAPSERGGRPADSRRRRVARGFLPAPGRGRRPPRAAPARRPAAAAGRRTERPFPGFRRPTRHVRPGSPGTAGSRPGARHCPAGNTAVAVACPHRPGPAAPGTARRAAVRRQTAARPAEAPPPRLEGRGAAPLRAPSLPPHPPALPGPPRLTLPHSQPVSFLISSISSSRSSVDAREPIAAPGPERKGRAAARCRGELRSRRATAVPQPPPPQHGPDRGRPALLRGRPSPHRLLSPRPPRPVRPGPHRPPHPAPQPPGARRGRPARMRAARPAKGAGVIIPRRPLQPRQRRAYCSQPGGAALAALRKFPFRDWVRAPMAPPPGRGRGLPCRVLQVSGWGSLVPAVPSSRMALSSERFGAIVGRTVKITLKCGVFQGVLQHVNPDRSLLLRTGRRRRRRRAGPRRAASPQLVRGSGRGAGRPGAVSPVAEGRELENGRLARRWTLRHRWRGKADTPSVSAGAFREAKRALGRRKRKVGVSSTCLCSQLWDRVGVAALSCALLGARSSYGNPLL